MSKLKDFLIKNKIIVFVVLGLIGVIWYINSESNRRRIARKIAEADAQKTKTEADRTPENLETWTNWYYEGTDIGLFYDNLKGVKKWPFSKVLKYTFKSPV